MNGENKIEDIEVTPELLARFDKPGPRYTSYPTVPEWSGAFGDQEYRSALAHASARSCLALSVYVHIPFCRMRCGYCGCNTEVLEDEGALDSYLTCLAREMDLVLDVLGRSRPVTQLHWGGGTPTSLDVDRMRQLFDAIQQRFSVSPDAEIALEVDPRVTTREQAHVLRKLGFNRISMGVQDLDAEVQEAIGRRQTEEQTRRLLEWCREAGFSQINMDLIYGLPGQRLERWTETVRKVIDMRPDRLAVYSFAYLPDRLPHQKTIAERILPTGAAKYELFAAARRMLLESGYRAIGMDHFALPTDELAIAMDQRRLHRNFMGYTVVAAEEMVGFGASAIGEIGDAYAQNARSVRDYCTAIGENRLATTSGCVLSADDKVRQWVIRQLMCNFYLDTRELCRRFGVAYSDYFAEEEPELRDLYEAGFLERDNGNLKVLPLGRVFIRNIAMVFDAYLKKPDAHTSFSRTV